MPTTIPSADLRQMSEEERARVLEDALKGSPEALDNYLALLDARLREFEHRYEIPTSALADALRSGRLQDTADVSKWLYLAQLRDDISTRISFSSQAKSSA
jgi:hypothetical protein